MWGPGSMSTPPGPARPPRATIRPDSTDSMHVSRASPKVGATTPHSPGGEARMISARLWAAHHVLPPPRPPLAYHTRHLPDGLICSGRAVSRHELVDGGSTASARRSSHMPYHGVQYGGQ